MRTIEQEIEEQRKKFTFNIEAFTLNGGSMLVNTYSGSTLSPTGGFEYHGYLSNAGGAYAVTAPAERRSPVEEPQRYPRQVLRRLEKLASEPLDEAAPEGEQEFMDWLNSD